MRSNFTEFFPPTEDQLSLLWEKAIIIPDSSALLSLLRYNQAASADILRAFEVLKDRLRLPYQVGCEFYKNCATVEKGTLNQYIELKKAIDKSRAVFDEGITKIVNSSRMPMFDPKKYKDEVEKSIANLRNMHADDQNLFEESYAPGKIVSAIEGLFEGKVSPQLNLEDIAMAATQRFELKIPPGYMDKEKSVNKFGDLVVWFEIIAIANEHKSPVIFITDDGKEDWWVLGSASPKMPRPELIKEFERKSQQAGFWMFQLRDFLEQARERGLIAVNDKTLIEVESDSIRTMLNKIERLERYGYEMNESFKQAQIDRDRAVAEGDSLAANELQGNVIKFANKRGSAVQEASYLKEYIKALEAGSKLPDEWKFFFPPYGRLMDNELDQVS